MSSTPSTVHLKRKRLLESFSLYHSYSVWHGRKHAAGVLVYEYIQGTIPLKPVPIFLFYDHRLYQVFIKYLLNSNLVGINVKKLTQNSEPQKPSITVAAIFLPTGHLTELGGCGFVSRQNKLL